METYFVVYIVLCLIAVLCSILGVKKNNVDLKKAYAIFSIIAGFVMAVGTHDASSSSSAVLYVSGSGGTGGMSIEAVLKTILYMMPPGFLGAILGWLFNK